MACLDTTVLVDLGGRGGPALKARAQQFLKSANDANEPLTTTRFTLAELYLGIERAHKKEIEEARVANVLEGLVVLEFNDQAARVFATTMAELFRTGTPIGDMDVLIASVAIAHDEVLVTRNAAHFSKISMLTIKAY